jgi:hypothetical protein
VGARSEHGRHTGRIGAGRRLKQPLGRRSQRARQGLGTSFWRCGGAAVAPCACKPGPFAGTLEYSPQLRTGKGADGKSVGCYFKGVEEQYRRGGIAPSRADHATTANGENNVISLWPPPNKRLLLRLRSAMTSRAGPGAAAASHMTTQELVGKSAWRERRVVGRIYQLS